MALVAYDYGSDSEQDEDEKSDVDETSSSKPEIISAHTSNGVTSTISLDISDDEDSIPTPKSVISNMFDKLPQKRDIISEIIEDKVEDFIPKAQIDTKTKAKVRISVPSLTDFEDLKREEPSSKKFKSSGKQSSLLSLLPPVKCVPMSNKSFVPNVLTQKNKVTTNQVKKISKPLIPDIIRKSKEVKSKINDSDDSDDDVDLPETFDEELWQKTCGKVNKKDIVEEQPVPDIPVINLAPEPIEPYNGLDNKAFKELVGKSSRIPRNIKLIDVNEDDLLAEKDLWMRKSLTDPDLVPKGSVEDDVDPTKRKKHHITYLAQQAKANEQELQSQWASSKFNRNQSRAKYGF